MTSFEAKKVNGGNSLFAKPALAEICKQYPHISFESYQSYQKKEATDPRVQKFLSPALVDNAGRLPLPEARELSEVDQNWKDAENEFPFQMPGGMGQNLLSGDDGDRPTVHPRKISEIDQNWTASRIELPFEKPGGMGQTLLSHDDEDRLTILAGAPAPVTKFLLLGFGSPHDKDYGRLAVRHYYLAQQILNNYLNRVLNHWTDSGYFYKDYIRFIKPEVICDSSKWYVEDVDWVKNKFSKLKDCAFKYAPISHILQVIDSPNVFVITFQPDNPVRQMLTDIVLESRQMPQAILCPRVDQVPPSRHPEIFEADETSDRVVQLFENYNGGECTGLPEISPGMRPWLYTHKQLETERVPADSPPGDPRPSVGATPEPTDTPAGSVAPSVGDVPSKSSAEPRERNPPVEWLALPDIGNWYLYGK